MTLSIGTKTNRTDTLDELNDAISRKLVEARLQARPLPDFPGDLPETLEQAYAIQKLSMQRWPDDLAGWKVAMIPPADRPRFGMDRLVGPVFSSLVQRVEAGSSVDAPVFEGGMAAIEAEFVFVLGETLVPQPDSISDQDLQDAISQVFCGAEVASSPMAVAVQRGATSIISDFGLNTGVLIGPEIPDWTSHTPESLTVCVDVDGERVGDANAAAVPGGLLNAFRFLVEHCARHGIELPAGSLVSTGAVTGVHDVRASSTARIDYGAFGAFEVRFVPIEPAE